MPPQRRPHIPIPTQKILYALSGNQCAHPDCTTHLVQRAAPDSSCVVIGEICHIRAISPTGPRADSRLTDSELNSHENLILLCPNHHTLVDRQPEDHSPSVLAQWKRLHESRQLPHITADVAGSVSSQAFYPTTLINQHIQNDIVFLRTSRFFHGFDTVQPSLAIATKVTSGEYSTGSAALRSRALAWCARFLARADHLETAEELLNRSATLADCTERHIADAFVSSQRGDRDAALRTLAAINTPMSRSASFFVVDHHDGSEKAIAWLHTAEVNATHLDPEGRCVLLARSLELARWTQALELLQCLTDDDLRDAPFLHHLVALSHLVRTVPLELRGGVIAMLPFAARDFPLAATPAALADRRTARRHFLEASRVAKESNCLLMATIDEEYALWLELRDPDHASEGRSRLESRLRDPGSAIRLVHLGIQFGLNLDLPAIEREIQRQIALNGSITPDAALARFSLVFAQRTPADVAQYLSDHFDELSKHIEGKVVRAVHIEALAKASRTQDARECLLALRAEGVPEVDADRLQRIIDEGEGSDPLQPLEEQFRKTDSIRDLVHLVRALEQQRLWTKLCEYGERLFLRTHASEDAIRVALALRNANKFSELREFLQVHKSFLEDADDLRLLYCWALCGTGDLLEARDAMAFVTAKHHQQYRLLEYHLALTTGDLSALSAYVAGEWRDREDRTAEDLMAAAELAAHLGLPAARDLTVAAVAKGDDDPTILAGAYFLASKSGWEDDPAATHWLRRAAELSGPGGPMRPITLQELIDRQPEWHRHEAETWRGLNRGDLPMFVAAQATHNPLARILLLPAASNPTEPDPRRRVLVPAYSGARRPTPLPPGGSVGMDVTALLTLGRLGLLNDAFALFDVIHVPHSTLSWLLHERCEVAFHQPSRIRDARRVYDLLAQGHLNKFVSGTAPPSQLSVQAGPDLAALLAHAAAGRPDDTPQRLVVRSGPVYRIASLMKDEADLSSYDSVLTGCQPLVAKLRDLGHLAANDAANANAYLSLHEQPWPNQPLIHPSAHLYLDDLALSHLLHTDLLELLPVAGFQVFLSPNSIKEANALLAYEKSTTIVADVLDDVRGTLNRALETRKLQVQPRLENPDQLGMLGTDHPALGIPRLLARCSSIIVDDRFFNKHPSLDTDGARAVIYSTLDVLDLLVEQGGLNPEDKRVHITRLRQAGYVFIPVDRHEVRQYLLDCTFDERGNLMETAELRALREHLQCCRMAAFLQLPSEGPWLDDTLRTLSRVLRDLWTNVAHYAETCARSDWIMRCVDLRGWSQHFGPLGPEVATDGYERQILSFVLPPPGASDSTRHQYHHWFENQYLAPLQAHAPEAYLRIIERYRQTIEAFADGDTIGRVTE